MKKWLFLALSFSALFMVLLPVTVTVGGEDEKLAYVGNAKCKMCHNKKTEGMYFDDWSETKHAKVFDLLKGDEQKDPKCLPCHTTGMGKPGGFVSLEETPKMVGVQCEMCHGPGQEHIKSKKDNVIPNKGVPKVETCQVCHNDTSPHWKPEKYTTKDGKKVGFDFEQAVLLINHQKVRDAIGKK